MGGIGNVQFRQVAFSRWPSPIQGYVTGIVYNGIKIDKSELKFIACTIGYIIWRGNMGCSAQKAKHFLAVYTDSIGGVARWAGQRLSLIK